MKQIGSKIRQARTVLELTQADLAELSGISLRSLKEMEQGKGNSTIGLVDKVLDALGLEIRIEPINK